MLEAGAEVDAHNHLGMTALLHAARNGNAETVRRLLLHGASVNQRMNDGATALFLANEQGHTAIVNLLTIFGAIDFREQEKIITLWTAP